MTPKPLISTRLSRPDDAGDLADIDVKSFELSWSPEEWYDLVRNMHNVTKDDIPRTVVVAAYYGTAIGFAVVKKMGKTGFIEKLAIKEQWRRKGAATVLLQDLYERAQDTRCESVALIMPESFVYPDENGELSVAVKWAKAVGLKPTAPFLKKHFNAYGTTEDGVKFIAPLNP